MQVCISPSEPARTDTVQGQRGRGAGPTGHAVLAHPDLVSRTHSPRDSPSLAHSSEEGPPFSGARHHLAPASRPVEPPCVAPGWDAAFSVSEECLVFGPDYSHVVLRPRPGYVPKVPTTPFRDQVVNLQALPSEEADPALELLRPLRALRIYVDCTQSFRSSEQLFVCYGGQQKGKVVSKQRLAHWIVDAIALAYHPKASRAPWG